MDGRSPKTYDRPMESGDAGAGGRSADDRQPSAATEIDVEEFLRSAYGAGLISANVGELLLEYLDELKARARCDPSSIDDAGRHRFGSRSNGHRRRDCTCSRRAASR